jgi:3-deoxy-D-manno-octulosonate 8-phosphate phosphatase (KDO 8-P phosphatase)
MKLTDRARRIELILSDVDGVLTDGGIIYDNQGIEYKQFHIRDGLGIKLWQRAGFKFGVLTARTSHIVKLRAMELGIEIVRQGFEQKLPVLREILKQYAFSLEQCCYIGDDLTDLPCIRNTGLGVAVSDATEEVRTAAAHITRLPGGKGAVRELVEMILKAKGRWDETIQNYTAD